MKKEYANPVIISYTVWASVALGYVVCYDDYTDIS